ncbi:MAG: three-Cys-motif partner protein TcmP [Patescibacteria group bacterium]|nr:three-Cys-motif partner protein TcmP [Patescibacteria group bacterium]
MEKCKCYKNENKKDGLCQKYKSKIDGLSVHCSGFWTEDKIRHFKHYAEMFSTGMKNKWQGRLYYIDLFAGPGKCIIRENQKEIDGTCLEVASLKDKFKKYFFVDKNITCIEDLKKRLEKHNNIEYYNDDCNIAIKKIVEEIPDNSLSLAIVDPDSLQFHFNSYKELAKRKIDLIVNYPICPVGRAFSSVLSKKSNSVILDKFHPGWRDVVDVNKKSWRMAMGDLIKDYINKIERLGYYSNSVKAPFKNDKNATMYYLLMFSKDKRGIEFWDKIINSFKKKKSLQPMF